MKSQPFADPGNCAKCGGILAKTVTRRYSRSDLIAAAGIGTMALVLLGLFIYFFSGDIGRGLIVLMGVVGLVAFGLYEMVGFTQTESLTCVRCGETTNGNL
jgi:FtsH-binding integral membrane protein